MEGNMKRIAISALHAFPSACARRAAIAAGELAAGQVPAHLQDGLPDGNGVLVDEVILDHHWTTIRTVHVVPDREPEARPFLWLRLECGDVVEFSGFEGGWSYSYDQYDSPQISITGDNGEPLLEAADLGDRRFLPALARWAESCGVEASPAIVATAQAAARDGVS